MRLYLQTPPEPSINPRYYQLVLEQDLFGDWILLREWGSQGQRGNGRREVFLERDQALAAFERARDVQIKRGYQVMFTKGMENPHG